MCELAKLIENANADEIDDILFAAKKRYSQLFPGWEVVLAVLEMPGDVVKQLDNSIRFLEQLKEKYIQSSAQK